MTVRKKSNDACHYSLIREGHESVANVAQACLETECSGMYSVEGCGGVWMVVEVVEGFGGVWGARVVEGCRGPQGGGGVGPHPTTHAGDDKARGPRGGTGAQPQVCAGLGRAWLGPCLGTAVANRGPTGHGCATPVPLNGCPPLVSRHAPLDSATALVVQADNSSVS